MKEALVSVIIPVYNMERLLAKCVRSVLNQTYKNLDVVLIDDGSTDSSGVICDQLKKEDSRIQLVHQDNKGIAGAFNTGFDVMKGDYVIFVDSDDYISPQMIAKLYYTLVEYDADIVQCEKVPFFNEDGIPYIEPHNEVRVFEPRERILEEFFLDRTMGQNLAARIFKRSLFYGIRCEEGRQSIDVVTSPKLLSKCKRYVYISGAYYYNYKSDGSISRGEFTERRWDDLLYADFFFEEFITKECPQFKEYVMYRIMSSALFAYQGIYYSSKIEDREKKLKIARERFDDSYPHAKQSIYFKRKSRLYKLKVGLFSFSAEIYMMLAKAKLKAMKRNVL